MAEIFIDWTAIHQKAVQYANKTVPNYEPNTPEHDTWLKAYDSEHLIQSRSAIVKATNPNP
jgi:hypothetical protein